MPETNDNTWLSRCPRIGQTVEARFGPPVPDAELQPFIDAWRALSTQSDSQMLRTKGDALRSSLAMLLQQHVERLRQETLKLLK